MDKKKQTRLDSPEAQTVADLEFMRWNEQQMATGVASIDAQHKELIRELNELHQACLVGASTHDIEKILIFLGNYVEMHFNHEEKIMEDRKCPIGEENCKAHAKFLKDYRKIVVNFHLERNCQQTAIEIKIMAAQWLVSHICRIDVKLRDAAQEGKDEG